MHNSDVRQLARIVIGAMALALMGAGAAPAQKYGGILRAMERGNPPSLSINDEATVDTSWALGPVYNTVVFLDPLKPHESLETVIPELASSWQWSADQTRLTLKLRAGVRWHDGKPFTANDVKHTYDVLRGVSPQKLRLNPRKGWFFNLKGVTTNGNHEVTFELGRPQPSFLLLLASGYTCVMPAHVPVAKLRTEAVGTGPFRLIEYTPDRAVKVRKNPDYFVQGRPYLDGIDFIVIKSKSTRMAAMASGQLDVAQPLETEQKDYDNLRSTQPDMRYHRTYMTSNVNVVLNTKKPPFDNQRLRQAVNLAVDRRAYAKGVHIGYIAGAFVLQPPDGVWGLAEDQLAAVPGYGDPVTAKEDARAIMRELGYSAANKMAVTVSTRQTANYVDVATWLLSELNQIYMDSKLEIIESGNWFGRMTRREYTIAMNRTGSGLDEPDVTYYENFFCGLGRNYTEYCNKDFEAMVHRQSQTTDPMARKALVLDIERKLITDVARISLGFAVDYHAHRPYVKNYVGHQTAYNNARMQEIWLDK
ncbi:MAG: ABC transporter substrate-binding protein [Candidatus Lambdaproteobacteria bacterium]|nr:ABC transporter substrate-binding protein [Candidatus Lambdaproteobacteria bacterium]